MIVHDATLLLEMAAAAAFRSRKAERVIGGVEGFNAELAARHQEADAAAAVVNG
jgi:hypothetical protein